MSTFKVGLIGLGQRGYCHLEGILTERDDVAVTFVSDLYEDRIAAAVKMVEEKKGNTPLTSTDYRKLTMFPQQFTPCGAESRSAPRLAEPILWMIAGIWFAPTRKRVSTA